MDQQPENKPEKDEVKGITDWEKHLKDKEHTDNSLQKQTVPSDEHVVAPAAPSATAPAAPRVHINGEGTSSVLPGHREPGGFWFFVLLIAFCVSALCGMYLSVHPGASCTQNKNSSTVVVKTSGTKNKGTEGIAWIKIRGVISEEDSSSAWSMPTGASYIAKRVREAAKEDKVKAIVLDINSPGGTVASVQDIYSELLKAKEQGKKIVALFRDVAASGAFYIAMAADQIVAEPGTITGSVGVIMQAGNVTGLFDKLGIKVEPITSGKYKDIGSAYRPMTDAERALLQDMVNDTYSQFLDVVKTACKCWKWTGSLCARYSSCSGTCYGLLTAGHSNLQQSDYRRTLYSNRRCSAQAFCKLIWKHACHYNTEHWLRYGAERF